MYNSPAAIRASILLVPLVACASPPPPVDRSLQAKLEFALEDFPGEVGVYVRHLKTGKEVAIRADELFPTASMIKVPILLALFDRVEKGELDWTKKLSWSVKRMYPGEDMLAQFKDGAQISLAQLVLLMETMSDNTASLWLQELAGTGTRINEWLAAHGFTRTRMNSRTPGRKDDWKRYGWGQTSPREMAELLVLIREARGISPSAAEEMYRSLTRSYWDTEALSQIPPWVQVASKQGAVSHSRSEVFLVNAPHGDWVCCVITRNQKDKSWKRDNDGFMLLRLIARLLWRHFEPDADWKPPSSRINW